MEVQDEEVNSTLEHEASPRLQQLQQQQDPEQFVIHQDYLQHYLEKAPKTEDSKIDYTLKPESCIERKFEDHDLLCASCGGLCIDAMQCDKKKNCVVYCKLCAKKLIE